jgi:hypothetical protein
VVVERSVDGGQASISSKLENYLGFPEGISGVQLAERARTQACRFGAELLVGREGVRGEFLPGKGVDDLADATKVVAKSTIYATGVDYRRLDLPNENRLLGAGVYYGAGASEASLCRSHEDVFIVGCGNSAGQPAMHFARVVRTVALGVRGPSLKDTLSKDPLTGSVPRRPFACLRTVKLPSSRETRCSRPIAVTNNVSGQKQRYETSVGSSLGGGPRGKAFSIRLISISVKRRSPARAFSSTCSGSDDFGMRKPLGAEAETGVLPVAEWRRELRRSVATAGHQPCADRGNGRGRMGCAPQWPLHGVRTREARRARCPAPQDDIEPGRIPGRAGLGWSSLLRDLGCRSCLCPMTGFCRPQTQPQYLRADAGRISGAGSNPAGRVARKGALASRHCSAARGIGRQDLGNQNNFVALSSSRFPDPLLRGESEIHFRGVYRIIPRSIPLRTA